MGRTPPGGGNGQADLEGHVEPRCAARSLNPAEVMEGIPTGGDQLQYSIQSACGSGDFERRARPQPEATETGYEPKEERLVAWIIGDVQEGVVGRVSLSDRSASARCAPPRHGSTSGAALVQSRFAATPKRAMTPVALQILGNHLSQLPVSLH